MKKQLREIKKTLKQIYRKLNLKFSNRVYVSFGENCLTDDILDRHKLKSFSTPYSSMISNAEYILNIEQSDFNDFLNLEYLEYQKHKSKGPHNGKLVPCSTIYNKTKNEYLGDKNYGFEFTHHDVIGSKEIRDKIQQRVDRMVQLRSKKKFIIFYHHRKNEKTNIEILLKDLQKIQEIYSIGKYKAEIVFFTQNLISKKENRSFNYEKKYGIHCFFFQSILPWIGGNDFWAKKDDDLIKEMVKFAKNL